MWFRARSSSIRTNPNIIIPACHACNNKKSAGEGDLRDWLIIAVGVDGHPEIYPLMFEMRDAYEKGFSKIGAAARGDRELTLRKTKGGLHVPGYEVPLPDTKPMEETLRYMARGLYFALVGKPYLPDQPLTLTFIPNEDYQERIDYFRSFVSHEWTEPMGNNVFNWMPITKAAEQKIFPILMTFFGKVLIVGWIGRESSTEKRQPTFEEMLRRKGKREGRLRGIVNRGLVEAPPDDLLTFLQGQAERKKRTLPKW